MDCNTKKAVMLIFQGRIFNRKRHERDVDPLYKEGEAFSRKINNSSIGK
jgi:hypothetical protein